MGQSLSESQRNGYEMSDLNVKRKNCRERKRMIAKSWGIKLEYSVKEFADVVNMGLFHAYTDNYE